MENTRRVFLRRGAVCISFCGSIVAGCASLRAGEIVLYRVPAITAAQAASLPQNLANIERGAKLEAVGRSSADSSVLSSLISGDPAANYPLLRGVTSVTLSLPQIENLDRISLSCSAEGTLSIATSNANLPPENPQWHNATPQNLATSVTANVGPAEAKYVRLTFNITAPGRVAGLAVYGNRSLGNPAFHGGLQKRLLKGGPVSFGLVSLANVNAKARAVYVSSDVRGADNMIDDQIATSYSFAAADVSPVAIVDLGKVCSLRRLSAAFGPSRGNLEFYVLQALPGAPSSGTLPDTLQLTDSAFASLKPAGSGMDDGTQGHASVEFPATAGRYVVVRWIPATQEGGSFTIAEIAAFGSDEANPLLAVNLNVGGQNGSAESKDFQSNELGGKEVIEAKDFKDIPAEGPGEAAPPAEGPPPNLPRPPPFTFIPQIQPISR